MTLPFRKDIIPIYEKKHKKRKKNPVDSDVAIWLFYCGAGGEGRIQPSLAEIPSGERQLDTCGKGFVPSARIS